MPIESDVEFESRMDLDTLKRAEEIKADSARFKKAKETADKEIEMLKKLKGKTFLTRNNKTLLTK